MPDWSSDWREIVAANSDMGILMQHSAGARSSSRKRIKQAAKPESDEAEAAPSPLSGLLAEPRRMRILAWLQEEGSARVKDLSQAFSVSEATIRQDLERLDSEGHIVREHGGAYLKSVPRQVQAMALQHLVNMDAKRKIGRAAAALVGNGETIILDAGSTTTEIASNLVTRQDLTVITNGLNIALMLGAVPSFSVHMPGGQFKAPTLSLSGEKSGDFFQDIFAGKLFLATAGISFEAGLTYPSLADMHIKRAMIKAASKVYVVADSTKIGAVSFSSLGKLDMVQTFITDEGIRDEDRLQFERLGIDVIIAS
ncbi:DeoR/GlpR family DNA-binding transcription regulator [Kaistia dalseonensis]|uniref:DeoR/GlpR family transcriptional regulator of sugar metabolism n=1 Tax=Kaistia dalseonensis TaxID=410840 RepID=A0ABU0HG15_9HYPH|nr:DeoR/GlpR family DNA-binding transcription regulator [Kaistia dalseonensis]MCX5497800.1 DeoR/GlpR family DNA-binding transcription regulator [Kaistia dalseonensis]MDQ0440444.1 DeoR/GlpR family transcriptional regulator of sugar metabolism [Kaistia dalseonensis]